MLFVSIVIPSFIVLLILIISAFFLGLYEKHNFICGSSDFSDASIALSINIPSILDNFVKSVHILLIFVLTLSSKSIFLLIVK